MYARTEQEVKQGTEKRPAAERARAARRAAQLRKEAGERAEAQRKLEAEEPLSKNDLLAMLGSAFRLPEDEPFTPIDDWTEQVEALYELLAPEEQVPLWPLRDQPTEEELEPVVTAPKRRKRGAGYNFTAEDISKLRDEQGLAWRQVAVNLGLESTFAARRAYRNLTGRAPSESKPDNVRRVVSKVGTAKGSTRKVHVTSWDDEADQDEIIEKLGNGARILIRRSVGNIVQEEDLVISRLIKLTWDGKNEDGPLVAHFTEREGGGYRTVRVADIKEVR